jgi:probable F420-dependent oxidoreductase
MKIGITVQVTDKSIGPGELAQAVEARGFHSLYVPEHTHLPVSDAEPPGLVEGVTLDDYRRTLDPYIALAAAATVTDRILLGTCVALVAEHDPIVLAKELATLDQLSGGRIVLGFGYGWNRQEAEDHGVDYARRRDVAREKLLCMQALWSDDQAEFHGEFVDLPPSFSWPKPVQQPRVRTLVGGAAGPKLFAAIVELCDGWMPIGGAGLSKVLPDLRRAMERAGRDPDQLHIVPIGTIPEPGKLAHYESVGITEVVLRVPARSRDEVLAVLDDYVQYVR